MRSHAVGSVLCSLSRIEPDTNVFPTWREDLADVGRVTGESNHGGADHKRIVRDVVPPPRVDRDLEQLVPEPVPHEEFFLVLVGFQFAAVF